MRSSSPQSFGGFQNQQNIYKVDPAVIMKHAILKGVSVPCQRHLMKKVRQLKWRIIRSATDLLKDKKRVWK